MDNEKIVRGYKVFNSDWTCTPTGKIKKQYTCPGKFEEDVDLNVCRGGMHFCKKVIDCFNYYKFNPNNKVAEVIAYGLVVEEGDKCCTDKLEIVREVSWYEVLELVNTGKDCTGCRNSGNWNSGNRNSGNCNSGDWNSGDYNSGNRNSGDWNKTDYSSGCFNTVEPKIYLFNKPSEWTYGDWLNGAASTLLNQIPADSLGLKYVRLDQMTDEEKKEYPYAETTGGYLKEVCVSQADRANWWKNLDAEEKEIILNIPNFDKAIFKEITGIDVDA